MRYDLFLPNSQEIVIRLPGKLEGQRLNLLGMVIGVFEGEHRIFSMSREFRVCLCQEMDSSQYEFKKKKSKYTHTLLYITRVRLK
jgi:hypothetical protein